LREAWRSSMELKKTGWAMAFNDFEDVLRSWWTGQQDAGGAYGQWEVESVPQPVGKEKFGDAEAAIILRDVQDPLGIALCAHHHVMLKMNASLRLTRAAGGVEPEGGIVFAGRLCIKGGRTLLG